MALKRQYTVEDGWQTIASLEQRIAELEEEKNAKKKKTD
jgi:hypothetical protein